MKEDFHSFSIVAIEYLANSIGISSSDAELEQYCLSSYINSKTESPQNFNLIVKLSQNLLEDFRRQKPMLEIKTAPVKEKRSKIFPTEKLKEKLNQLSNNFSHSEKIFGILSEAAKNEHVQLNLPTTLLPTKDQKGVFKIFNRQGLVRTKFLRWDMVAKLIDAIHSTAPENNAYASLIKTQNFTHFYKQHESKMAYMDLLKFSGTEGILIFQQFVHTNATCKYRIHYSKSLMKVYKIFLMKTREREMLPLVFNDMTLKKLYSKELLHVLLAICEFYLKISYKDILLRRYLQSKVTSINKKLDDFDKPRKPQTNIIKSRENPKIEMIEITSSYTISHFTKILNEVKKSICLFYKEKRFISEFVADFVESDGLLYMIKTHCIKLANKIVEVPAMNSITHISIFSAIDKANLTKFKGRQFCCGSYCSLFKNTSTLDSEKLETLLSKNPAYTNMFPDLMDLHSLFARDPLDFILKKHKRPTTPIDQGIQYKILRKIIIEDMNDQNSLKSRLMSLPDALRKELDIDLDVSTQMINMNRRIFWELEILPVCYKCYQIYRLKNITYPQENKQSLSKIKKNKSIAGFDRRKIALQQPVLRKRKISLDSSVNKSTDNSNITRMRKSVQGINFTRSTKY